MVEVEIHAPSESECAWTNEGQVVRIPERVRLIRGLTHRLVGECHTFGWRSRFRPRHAALAMPALAFHAGSMSLKCIAEILTCIPQAHRTQVRLCHDALAGHPKISITLSTGRVPNGASLEASLKSSE